MKGEDVVKETLNLSDHGRVNNPTYEGSVIQGLTAIIENPYTNGPNRMVSMIIPSKLAVKKGSDAHKFIVRSGLLRRSKEAGVNVEISAGTPFSNKLTGEVENTLIIDFKPTAEANLEVIRNLLTLDSN